MGDQVSLLPTKHLGVLEDGDYAFAPLRAGGVKGVGSLQGVLAASTRAYRVRLVSLRNQRIDGAEVSAKRSVVSRRRVVYRTEGVG